MALPWWLGFMETDFNDCAKTLVLLNQVPRLPNVKVNQTESLTFSPCAMAYCAKALNCVRQTSVWVRLIDSQQLNFISPYFFSFWSLWQSMPTPALCVPKAGDCWCFPVTQLSNCRNSNPSSKLSFFFFSLMCPSQGLWRIYFLQPLCHPKLLPSFQQHQFLWAFVLRKVSLKLADAARAL